MWVELGLSPWAFLSILRRDVPSQRRCGCAQVGHVRGATGSMPATLQSRLRVRSQGLLSLLLTTDQHLLTRFRRTIIGAPLCGVTRRCCTRAHVSAKARRALATRIAALCRRRFVARRLVCAHQRLVYVLAMATPHRARARHASVTLYARAAARTTAMRAQPLRSRSRLHPSDIAQTQNRATLAATIATPHLTVAHRM